MKFCDGSLHLWVIFCESTLFLLWQEQAVSLELMLSGFQHSGGESSCFFWV